MGRFRVRDANRHRDGHALFGFRCWAPGEDEIQDEDEDEDESDDEDVGESEGDADPSRQEKRDVEKFWIREVEEYVRYFALRKADRVLIFEADDGELAGITAFNRENVGLAGRRRVAGWRLEVMALSIAWQGKWVEADIAGCPTTMKASEFMLRSTFRRMLELDARRIPVVARVHEDNRASMVVAARVGLDRTHREPESPHYWAMLGQIDPTAGQT